MRQFQCVPTTRFTENKEENYVHCNTSFKHPKLPISIKIPVTLVQITAANCLYLHDSYITKFDFMNYAFAKLVDAW